MIIYGRPHQKPMLHSSERTKLRLISSLIFKFFYNIKMWSEYLLPILLLLAILNSVECGGGRERKKEKAWKKHVKLTDHYEEQSGGDFEDLVEPEQSETESEHESDDEADTGLEGGEDEAEWERGQDPVDPLLESPRNKGIVHECDSDTRRKMLIECTTLLNTESGNLASFVGRWRNGYPDQGNERFRNKCLQKVRDGQAPRIDEQQKKDLGLFVPHPKSKAAQNAPKEKPRDEEGGSSDPKAQADIIEIEGKKQDQEFVKV